MTKCRLLDLSLLGDVSPAPCEEIAATAPQQAADSSLAATDTPQPEALPAAPENQTAPAWLTKARAFLAGITDLPGWQKVIEVWFAIEMYSMAVGENKVSFN